MKDKKCCCDCEVCQRVEECKDEVEKVLGYRLEKMDVRISEKLDKICELMKMGYRPDFREDYIVLHNQELQEYKVWIRDHEFEGAAIDVYLELSAHQDLCEMYPRLYDYLLDEARDNI